VRDPGGHAAKPVYVEFTPDGKKLISAAEDQTVQVWDVGTGERLRVIRPPVGLDGRGGLIGRGVGHPLVVDRQGERVAFCVQAKDDQGRVVKTTFVCSLATGQAQVLKRTGPRDFAPDGKTLAVAEGQEVRLIDIATDKAALPPVRVKNAVHSLAFSPDGKTLAAIDGGAQVHLFDGATLKPRPSRTVPGTGHGLQDVGWADDQTLVCRSQSAEQALVVLDAATGELKHSYPRDVLLEQHHKGAGDTLVDLRALPGTTKAFVRTANKLPDGRGSNGSFVFDWATGEASKAYLHDSTFGCGAGAVAPDLGVAAQGDGERNDIILWDPRDGQAVRRLRAAVRGTAGEYWTMCWRPDGKAVVWEKLANGADRGYAELDLTTLTLKNWRTADQFAKYGRQVAALVRGDKETAGPADDTRHLYPRGIVREWGALTLHDIKDKTFTVSGGPQPVAAEKCWGVCGWDFTFVAGGRVVTHPWGSSWLQVFDSATGKCLHAKEVTQSYIRSVAVSPRPECRYVLVGSADQTLTVFNPETGKVLLTVFPAGQDWIAWTPEGWYAATPGGERLMGWQVENGPDRLATFYPAERFRKQLYRPDVIQLVLEKGSVEEALAAANAARKQGGGAAPDQATDVAKLLPPRATLDVTDRSRLAQGKVKLRATAEAAAPGQPVTALRLLVDGRPLPDGQGVLDLKDAKEKARADWEITLPPGPHELKVLARGRDTAGASAAVPLDVPLPVAGRPALHVIAVGIDAYPQKALRLTCAVADATGLARAFAEHCAGPGNLFGEAKVTPPLLDGDAKRGAVLAALKGARASVRPGDLLVFSFAGHGARHGKEFYLLTHDADPDKLAQTALSGEDLRLALADMPCQVLLLLDACHSAAGVRAFIDEAARGLTDDETGVAVLCAAMGYEEAQERDGHGLFTRAVIGALSENAGVPFNRHDRRMYVLHLGAFVEDEVREWSKDAQHPFLIMPYVTESFPIRQVARQSPGGR
jgi:WD40 repeat protein